MNVLIFNHFWTKSIKNRVTCIDFKIRIRVGHGPVTCTRNLTFSPSAVHYACTISSVTLALIGIIQTVESWHEFHRSVWFHALGMAPAYFACVGCMRPVPSTPETARWTNGCSFLNAFRLSAKPSPKLYVGRHGHVFQSTHWQWCENLPVHKSKLSEETKLHSRCVSK